MEIKNNRKIIELVFLFWILIVSINLISAIGISKEYFEGNPAKVGPGETKEISFGLIIVNPEEGDRNIVLNLTEGGEIASIIGDKSFTVLAGSRDKIINLRISIPKDTPEGTKYTVALDIKDNTIPNGTQMVGFTKSSTSSIPILVEKEKAPVPEPAPEKPAGDYTWYIIIAVLIIIIAIVAYFLLRNKESGKSK